MDYSELSARQKATLNTLARKAQEAKMLNAEVEALKVKARAILPAGEKIDAPKWRLSIAHNTSREFVDSKALLAKYPEVYAEVASRREVMGALRITQK